MVLWVLLHENTTKYDSVNFHIAYPNCTYIKLLKKFIYCPIVITEHWSAYHFNFNAPDPNKLNRIRQIFHHNLSIITVSRALANDILQFSGADFPFFVVPNVVDTKIFYYYPKIRRDHNIFFMVSQWKWPKDPFTIINKWPEILKRHPYAVLRIGGYGPQWYEMKTLVKTLKLENSIIFLGKLTPLRISEEMNQAFAFIHYSKYETFSVVCAEAVCCGLPVIAKEVGGISEFINETNGILVGEEDDWSTKLREMTEKQLDTYKVSRDAQGKFSKSTVGAKYFRVMKKIING